MSELIIVAVFFLVPLFLFMTMIVRFLDMRAATLQASRYVAFERTVYSVSGNQRSASMAKLSDAKLNNSVATRFFSDNVDRIDDSQYSGTIAPKAFWSDAGGHRLVTSRAQVQRTDLTGTGKEPGTFAADYVLKKTLGTWNSLMPSQLTGLNGFDLTYNQYYNLQVSVTPGKPQGKILSQLPSVSFKDNDAILADGWSASDIKYEHDQAQRAVPTAALHKLFGSGSAAGTVLGFIGKVAVPDLFGGLGVHGNFIGDSLGYVQVDKAGDVPADRLAHYSPSTSGSGSSGQNIQAVIDQYVKQYAKQGFTLTKKTHNSDGSWTLTFTNSQGATVSTTVGGSGGPSTGSSKTTSEHGTVYNVTWGNINDLENNGGYSLNSVTFTCKGTTCPKYKKGPNKGKVNNTLADKATASLSKTVTFKTSTGQSVSSTSTVSLKVVKDPNNSANSLVTQTTSGS